MLPSPSLFQQTTVVSRSSLRITVPRQCSGFTPDSYATSKIHPEILFFFRSKKTCNEHSLQVKYIFGCAFPANALTCERSDSATPPKNIGKLLHSGATVRDFHPIPSLIYFRHPVDIIITPRNRSHKSLNLFINDSL